MLTSSNCESRGESSYLKFHGLNFQWRSSFFVCFRIRVTWPMKCDIICTRNCVAWYVCVAGVFVTWSAHNWLLHAIELCILTFLKRTKRGSLESVKNRLHLIEIHPIQIWDFDKLKTQNTPFTNPFSSIPNDILTEITIKSDRDLLTDGLGPRITARPQDYSRRFKHFGKMTQFWEFLHERIITSIEIFEIHQHNSLKLEFVSSANENGFIWTFLFPKH